MKKIILGALLTLLTIKVGFAQVDVVGDFLKYELRLDENSFRSMSARTSESGITFDKYLSWIFDNVEISLHKEGETEKQNPRSQFTILIIDEKAKILGQYDTDVKISNRLIPLSSVIPTSEFNQIINRLVSGRSYPQRKDIIYPYKSYKSATFSSDMQNDNIAQFNRESINRYIRSTQRDMLNKQRRVSELTNSDQYQAFSIIFFLSVHNNESLPDGISVKAMAGNVGNAGN